MATGNPSDRRGQSSVEPMLVLSAVTVLLIGIAMFYLPQFVDICSVVVNWFADQLRIDR